ncbi:MAG: hypothetical protein ACQEWZ_00090 [Pseudomonadota bacterium]
MELYEDYEEFNVKVFSDIAGEDVVDVVFSKAPTKVLTRVCKAIHHFEKAKALSGVDEEMAAIRLIAVEEELVVAVFELIKYQRPGGGEYRTFVKKFNNHRVKLAFYPVMSQLKFIIQRIFSGGFSLEGMEGLLDLHAELVVENGKAFARLYFGDEGKYINHNPMSLVISLEDKSYDEVLQNIYQEFKQLVRSQTGFGVKEFVTQRADFRNKILYASDSGVASMGEDLEFLINDVFTPAVHDLLWVICILVSHPIDKSTSLLLRQFFDLYGMILKDAGIKDISP